MSYLWGNRLSEPGMQETPDRVLRHWEAASAGLNQDPSRHLEKHFPCEYGEAVILKKIPFVSMCEHHLLPFYGHASVAYVPTESVVGLSKIPRALADLAARPQMQERLTHQLMQVIMNALKPAGAGVVVVASHTCMSLRGIQALSATTLTKSFSGSLVSDITLQSELLRSIE